MIARIWRVASVRALIGRLYSADRDTRDGYSRTGQHLISGWDPMVLDYLEPRLTGRIHPVSGTEYRDFSRVVSELDTPLKMRYFNAERPVWHCALRAAPQDRELTDAEWASIANVVVDRTGIAPHDDDWSCRWVAVRTRPDATHIVATLARQDGATPHVWRDFVTAGAACEWAEDFYGLRRVSRWVPAAASEVPA